MFRDLKTKKQCRKEKIFSGIFFSLILVLAVSCKHQPLTAADEPIPLDTTAGNNGGNLVPCDSDTVYFSNTILPLFISNCAKPGCHDAGSHLEGLILNSYANIMASGKIVPYNANEGGIPQSITTTEPGDIMPPPPSPPLTPEQINLILTWINQGAQNNYCDDCDTLNVTYSGKIKHIIDLNCTGCHSGSNPGGNINLSAYSGLQVIALNGRLMGSITHQSGYSGMPKNAPSLPQCEIDAIRIWVDSGAPNN